jgi:hypothetical protein
MIKRNTFVRIEVFFRNTKCLKERFAVVLHLSFLVPIRCEDGFETVVALEDVDDESISLF